MSSTTAHIEETGTCLAYLYDGTLEGLLTCIFESYAAHEEPTDILKEAEDWQPRIGQISRFIPTDESLAKRVRAGIVRDCGAAAYKAVRTASLADSPEAPMVIYRFVKYAMSQRRPHDCTNCTKSKSCPVNGAMGICPRNNQRSVMNQIAHPAVEPILALCRRVANEGEAMRQFVRFEHLENGVWLARCNPNASVIPVIMNWFVERFNTQPFVIFDETHHISGVYDGNEWYLVDSLEPLEFARAEDEQTMQRAWCTFYDTISVEARYHPELRRQFMPKRLWKNITEVKREA